MIYPSIFDKRKKLMSRSLIIGLVVTLAIMSGLAAFFYINFIKVKGKSAIDAVPEDAAVVLEVKNIQQSWGELYASDMWKDLQQNEAIVSLTQFVAKADSLLNTNDAFKTVLSDNKVAVSFHANNGNNLGVLLIAEIGSNEDGNDFLNWMAQVSNGKLVKRIFDKEAIYEIVNQQQQNLYSIAIRDQLMIVSEDGTLVEGAVHKLKYQGSSSAKGFEQVKGVSNVGSDISVFINYKNFHHFLALMNKEEYKDGFQYIRSFANWSVLNIDVEKDRMEIEGVTFTDDSLFQFLDLFKTQSPVEVDLSAYLPVNTAYSFQLNFSNYGQFNSDLNEYLQNTGKLESYLHYVDSIEDRYLISITDKLVPQIGEAALLGIHEGNGQVVDEQVYAVIKFKDPSAIATIFDSYAQAIEKRGEADFVPAVYNGNTIKKLQLGNILKLFYGHLFEHIQSPYYTIKNDVVILANSEMTLKLILDEVNGGSSLAANQSYKDHQKHASASSNVDLFLSPGKSFQLPNIFGNETFISAINRYAYDIKKFEFVEVQYSNSANNSFYTKVNIKFNPSFKEETKVLWSAQLDTTFEMQPVLVYNSELKQKAIIVQDVMNTVYYINNAGQILWRSKLSGKINSQIFEVDPTQTGDIHYLFSTNKQVCLISNKGVNIYGYPVRLPGTATAGINLVDFYGDSTFQYFVPLDNNKIMGYSLSGKPVQGWNPKSVESKITTRLGAFVLGTGAYVCGTASNGKLLVYGLSATQTRPTVDVAVSAMYPSYVFSTDTSAVTIWVTDSAGKSIEININSMLEVTYKQSIETTLSDKYHYILGSNAGYVSLSAFNGGFAILKSDGQKLFTKTYQDSLATLPFFVFTHDHVPMVGYAETQLEKIHLFDLKGVEYPSFPIQGATPFILGDILLNNANYLVCGNKTNNLLLYRLK